MIKAVNMFMHENRIATLAILTGISICMFAFESFLPKPLPFLRLGLANLIVLLLLINKHSIEAAIVTLGKVCIGGFITGMFFSPANLLSFAGSITSFFVMFAAIQLPVNFSCVGISIIGAVIHNLAQLVCVRWIIIQDNSVFRFFPLMVILGILTGGFIGYLTALIQKKLLIKEQNESVN